MEKPLVYHGLSMSIQNKALTVVSKQRLKTTPTFALEKQTRLERKQTRFILTLPVAGAVSHFKTKTSPRGSKSSKFALMLMIGTKRYE